MEKGTISGTQLPTTPGGKLLVLATRAGSMNTITVTRKATCQQSKKRQKYRFASSRISFPLITFPQTLWILGVGEGVEGVFGRKSGSIFLLRTTLMLRASFSPAPECVEVDCWNQAFPTTPCHDGCVIPRRDSHYIKYVGFCVIPSG